MPALAPPLGVGAWTPTLPVPAGVWAWTPTEGAGADGLPVETPALVVPPGVAVEADALTPLVPAEACAVVCVGATLAPALAEDPPDVGAETVALADADDVCTDAEAVAPLDPVETETDAVGVCTLAPADGSCGPSAAAVPACARANAAVAAAIANVRPRVHALARIAGQSYANDTRNRNSHLSPKLTDHSIKESVMVSNRSSVFRLAIGRE